MVAGPCWPAGLLVCWAQLGPVLVLLQVKFETCTLEVLAPTCPPAAAAAAAMTV